MSSSNEGEFGDLPSSVVTEILSDNIRDYRDLAQIRLVSKDINGEVLPTLLKSVKFLKCCNRSTSDFFSELLMIGEGKFSGGEWTSADDWTDLFEGLTMVSVKVIMDSYDLRNKMQVTSGDDNSMPSASLSHATTVGGEQNLNSAQICHSLCDTKSVAEFEEIGLKAAKAGIFEPISGHTSISREESDVRTVLAILTFEIDSDNAACITNPSAQDELLLRTRKRNDLGEDEDEESLWYHLHEKESIFRGYVVPNNDEDEGEDGHGPRKLVRVPIHINEDWCYMSPMQTLLPLSDIYDRYQRATLISEGVAFVDGAITLSLHQKLMNQIDRLAQSQEEVDYHPHSNNIVRDLVHPALYAYVNGESTVLEKEDIPPCNFPNSDHNDSLEPLKDYWGREYDVSMKYQWLPTYFDISPDGACTICDYINNIGPRAKYTDLYSSLEELFSQALPLLESVYSYGRVIKPHLRQWDEDQDFDDGPIPDVDETHCSLKGQRLQVVTKIVDYELGPGQSYEGVWHVEGMSHEEIVATSIYVLDRDDDIIGGNILFKRAFLDYEADYIFSHVNQCRPAPLDEFVDEGLVPMGQLETPCKRLIAFPNSHIHKVSKMHNKGGAETTSDESMKKKRRIVVFFLINPETRIISTREVPPQQEEFGGDMTREEAFKHRLELMKERKYTKQDWNVRPIELCEH